MTDTIHAWDKLDTDTDKSYQAFCVYRDLGTGRSLEKVQERLGKSTGYLRQLYRWSSNYNWVERANAYDLHLDQLQRQAVEQHITNAKAQHIASMVERIDKLYTKWDDIYSQYSSLRRSKRVERQLDDGTVEITQFAEVDTNEFYKLIKGLTELDSVARRQYELPDRYSHQKIQLEGDMNVNTVNETIRKLEEAGLDPAQTFQELINELHASTVNAQDASE